MSKYGRSVTPDTWEPHGGTETGRSATPWNWDPQETTVANAKDSPYYKFIEDSARVESAIERGKAGFSGPSATHVEENTNYNLEAGGLQDESGDWLYQNVNENVRDAAPDPPPWANIPWKAAAAVVVLAILAWLLRPVAKVGANVTGG